MHNCLSRNYTRKIMAANKKKAFVSEKLAKKKKEGKCNAILMVCVFS